MCSGEFLNFFFLAQLLPKNPTVGDIYGIKSSIDSSYKRGIVQEKLNENQYRIVYFDLGTEDIVSSNSFVNIPDELKEVYNFSSMICTM